MGASESAPPNAGDASESGGDATASHPTPQERAFGGDEPHTQLQNGVYGESNPAEVDGDRVEAVPDGDGDGRNGDTSRPDLAREEQNTECAPRSTDPAGPASRKRKRPSSPPWTFPTAQSTTVKTSDGRRASARVNTGGSTPVTGSDHDGGLRSSSLSTPPLRSRAASPPWKKFAPDAPSIMMVDGKRKSGRVHKDAAEPKRVSPRSKKQVNKVGDQTADSPLTAPPSAASNKKRSDSKSALPSATRLGMNSVKDPSDPSDTKIAHLRAQINALKPVRSSDTSEQPKRRGRPKRVRDVPDQFDGAQSPEAPDQEMYDASLSPDTNKRMPKLKLRFNPVKHVIPPPHPNAVMFAPAHPPQLSMHQVLQQFELQEMQQPYMENDRGPPDLAWFLNRAQRQAEEEGVARRRLLDEAKPGGVLTKEKLSIYQASEPQAEPPKQYGHHDHLVAHALNLRFLQTRERTQHRQLAKKVAYEALEFWKAKRGPTEEDLREEQDKIYRLIYKQVVTDVRSKWELVGAHVHQQRVKLWEAEQEQKRQERLQKKLEWSENMVARQRGEAGSEDEAASPLDVGDLDSEEDEYSGNDNMIDSDSDAGSEESGGEMGPEALAAYMAQREVEPPDKDHDEMDVDDNEMTESRDLSTSRMVAPGSVHDDAQNDVTMLGSGRAHSEAQDNAIEDTKTAAATALPRHEATSPTAEEEQEANEEGTDAQQDSVDDGSIEPAQRRSRRSEGEPLAELDETDAKFGSDDESTDMDSTDYDSDEDMDSSSHEENSESDDADNDGAKKTSKGDTKLSFLAGFYPKSDRDNGLPTPTTSAEGDERDVAAIAGVSSNTASMNATAEESSQTPQVANHADTSTMEIEIATDDHLASRTADASPSSAPSDPIKATSERPISSSAASAEAATKHMVPNPTLLRGTLRSYQHAGLDWLASLYRSGTNGILADEMGLGKTIQTIALLAHLAEEHACWEAHLVVVPTSVILNWVMEFQKFLPGFRVLGYYGTAEERQQKRRGWVNDPHHDDKDKRGYNVVVTSYNVAMQDINAIRNVQWHYLVLDEAHNIRNFNSQRWQVLIRLKTRARLLLTGTPLQNSLTELWSLLTFLTAGDDDPAHGDLEEFLSHWKDPVKEIFDKGVQSLSQDAQRVVDKLHVSLRPFLLRRLKNEVEKDLPKKTESVVVCKLSKRQRQLYQDYMGLADTRRNLTQGNAVTAGKVLLSLRRVCNHPDLFDPRGVQTSFAMATGPIEEFAGKEAAVRRLLGVKANTPRGLLLLDRETHRKGHAAKSKLISANKRLRQELQSLERTDYAVPDVSSSAGCVALQRLKNREKKLERLRSCIRTSENNLEQSMPTYGADLTEVVTIHSDRPYAFKMLSTAVPPAPFVRTSRAWPKLGSRPLVSNEQHPADWKVIKTTRLQREIMTVEKYAEDMKDTIAKFAFCTPVVSAPVLDYCIPAETQQVVRASTAYPIESDFSQESRSRLSIAFPDSRLLIFDSGKLQQLTHLLRSLQSRGSRSLIFAQMTGTLNILEQFLNLLGLPYLRLDGSTPVERRQLYSAEFNRPDSKYQCMILSSRAGGVGLNLVGASSVIFYDLDWNPQMDRQCMDRAHRIGQVRDVEVYKMVSEKTVEENILKRAEQKSLLDRTVIQEGHFTTDHQRETPKETPEKDDDVAVAIDRFLGGGEKATTQAIESVEDREDVAAAQQARKEEHQDDADFTDRSSNRPSVAPTPGQMEGDGADEDSMKGHVDSYMVFTMQMLMRDVPFVPPQLGRRVDKHGRDPSHRKKRKR